MKLCIPMLTKQDDPNLILSLTKIELTTFMFTNVFVCSIKSILRRIEKTHTFRSTFTSYKYILLLTHCIEQVCRYSTIKYFHTMESFTEAFICNPIWIMQRENCLLVLWSCSKTPVSGNVLYVVFIMALFVIILRRCWCLQKEVEQFFTSVADWHDKCKSN